MTSILAAIIGVSLAIGFAWLPRLYANERAKAAQNSQKPARSRASG